MERTEPELSGIVKRPPFPCFTVIALAFLFELLLSFKSKKSFDFLRGALLPPSSGGRSPLFLLNQASSLYTFSIASKAFVAFFSASRTSFIVLFFYIS